MKLQMLEKEVERFSSMVKAIMNVPPNLKEAAMTLLFHILVNYRLRILPSLDDVFKFSYARKEGDSDNRRVKTTLPKIVRRQLPKCKISDHELRDINEYICGYLWDVAKVHRLYGQDIVEAYREYIHTSCMSRESCEYVEIYAKNPDKVSLLAVFNEEGECVSKALLWKTDSGKLILDRLYSEGAESFNGIAILGEARRLGAEIQDNPYSPLRTLFAYEEEISLKNFNVEYVPYVDSWLAKFRDKFLVLNKKEGVSFDSTSGEGLGKCPKCGCISVVGDGERSCSVCSYDQYHNAICCCCGEGLDEEEAYYNDNGDAYCGECYHERYFTCDRCIDAFSNDESTTVNSRYGVIYVCDFCSREYYTQCEECGEFFENDAVVEVEGNGEYCTSCAVSIATPCVSCGRFFMDDEINHQTNASICDSCIEEEVLA